MVLPALHEYENVYFTTCTIVDWKPLLEEDCFKDIIIDSFNYHVKSDLLSIWAFVIMKNHFHVVWQLSDDLIMSDIQRNVLKYTAQQFKFKLYDNADKRLSQYISKRSDRQYQFWKRKSYNIPIFTKRYLDQKINYIHNNVFNAHGTLDREYKYSSALYFESGTKNWKFLTTLE